MRLGQAETPHAALAQLVEHRIRNAGVVGSNPIGGTITLMHFTSARIGSRWLNSSYAATD